MRRPVRAFRGKPPIKEDKSHGRIRSLQGNENLQLGIENDILTIEGPAAMAGEAFHGEFGARGYRRRFQLPENLELEKVAAELKEGVLTVRLPKAAAARARRIEVTVH